MKHIEQAKTYTQKICTEMGETEIGSPFLIRFTGKNVIGFGIMLTCNYYQFKEFVDRLMAGGLNPDLRNFHIMENSQFLDEMWVEVPEDFKLQ